MKGTLMIVTDNGMPRTIVRRRWRSIYGALDMLSNKGYRWYAAYKLNDLSDEVSE